MMSAAIVNSEKTTALSRYESQKRRDWNTFGQYLKNHKPPLLLSRCSGAHILEFLRYLDQFGKTRVHNSSCPFFGHPQPPVHCPCPLRQAWGSLDALVGRLRAAFEENGGTPETNPFGARAVRLYLREVRDTQAKARGIAYEKRKKKRKKPSLGARARPRQKQAGCTSSSSSMSMSMCMMIGEHELECCEEEEVEEEERSNDRGGLITMMMMMAGTPSDDPHPIPPFIC